MNFAETEEDKLLWYMVLRLRLHQSHVSGNKLFFIDLDVTFREDVKLGNNTSMSVMGKGNIKVLVINNMRTITSVFYVPAHKSNLMSLG